MNVNKNMHAYVNWGQISMYVIFYLLMFIVTKYLHQSQYHVQILVANHCHFATGLVYIKVV